MSSFVETMMSRGLVPWHRQGNIIPQNERIDVKRGIIAAGLDWSVALKPLVIADKIDHYLQQQVTEIKHKAVVRTDKDNVLGIVGPQYTPLQNIKAIEWFQPFLDSGSCELETAGSLCGGTKVWVMAKLKGINSEVVKGDDIAKYLMLSNSHDGTMSVRVTLTPIRTVCWNTLSLALKHGESIRIRHTSQLTYNLEQVRQTINTFNATFESTIEQYKYLANKSINQRDLRKYVKVVLGIDPEQPEYKLSTRLSNKIDAITQKMETGIGINIPHVKGTYWGAYNAVNEYLNYNFGKNQDRRLNSLWFGQNAQINRKALTIALEMAN